MSLVRYTPFLDKHGIHFDPTLPDSVVNIIDSCLAYIEASIEWGEWEGKQRKPCPEQPMLLSGQPIGQYHCPSCGMMIMAAMPHLSPVGIPHPQYPIADYEIEYQRPWPPGYVEDAEEDEDA